MVQIDLNSTVSISGGKTCIMVLVLAFAMHSLAFRLLPSHISATDSSKFIDRLTKPFRIDSGRILIPEIQRKGVF